MLDNQGRITIGKEICDNLGGYVPGTEVFFSYEGGKKYRLIPESEKTLSDKIVSYAGSRIDNNYRLIVPSCIRQNYTRHAIMYGSIVDGYIYIEFMQLS